MWTDRQLYGKTPTAWRLLTLIKRLISTHQTSMKKLNALLLTVGLAASTALAAPFSSPNNIVVLRAGTASTGSQGFLDEYTPAGALVQPITVPTTTATTPPTGSGTSIVFGQTTALIHETSLSDDGAFVVI